MMFACDEEPKHGGKCLFTEIFEYIWIPFLLFLEVAACYNEYPA